MSFVLDDLASDECRFDLDLRGQTVPIRWVPSRIQRKIEQLITVNIPHGEPKEVEKYLATPAHQKKLDRVKFLQQCLRAAYAGDMTVRDITWSDDLSSADAMKMAEGVEAMLTDAEIAQIYEASYASLRRRHDAAEQIGTGDAEGN